MDVMKLLIFNKGEKSQYSKMINRSQDQLLTLQNMNRWIYTLARILYVCMTHGINNLGFQQINGISTIYQIFKNKDLTDMGFNKVIYFKHL